MLNALNQSRHWGRAPQTIPSAPVGSQPNCGASRHGRQWMQLAWASRGRLLDPRTGFFQKRVVFLFACFPATPLCVAGPMFLDLPATASQQDIQLALDHGSDGCEVRLGQGTFVIRKPIFLRKDNDALCGTGGSTVLYLADGANCPVVVLGAPLARPALFLGE